MRWGRAIGAHAFRRHCAPRSRPTLGTNGPGARAVARWPSGWECPPNRSVARPRWPRMYAVALRGVATQGPARRRVNGDQARFTELRLAHGKHTRREVDIGPRQPQRLQDAEARARQEAAEGGVGA